MNLSFSSYFRFGIVANHTMVCEREANREVRFFMLERKERSRVVEKVRGLFCQQRDVNNDITNEKYPVIG